MLKLGQLSLFLVPFAIVWLTPVKGMCAYFTVSETKLLGGEFASTRWGGTVTRTDVPGAAVQFSFSGLSGSSTGLKDDYPVDTVYGQVLPSHGNGDFSNFSGFALRFENLDSESVSVSVFINTGFTGPSGNPPSNLANDTFWQCAWTEIPPGQTRIVRLDFDSAIPWNIDDNPLPHTQGSNGVSTSINDFDRQEISAIGFQIAASGGNSEATVHVSPVSVSVEMRGVSYTAWSRDALLSEDSDGSLADAAEIGCNWIAICVWWFQDNINSSIIEPDYGRYSASPESVVHAIATCHKLGMKVMLKAMIDCRDGSWRGYINPGAAWFAEYHDFINFWADIARDNDVELFCVGCELVNTVSWASSWRSVIQDVKDNHYSGPLTYAANHGNEQSISWWDELDYIGIDAYYSLTGKNNPTLAELKTAWSDRADAIESWRNSNWSCMDIIFTEVGYQSVDGTNITPWWRDPASYPVDLQEQADCYEALLSQCQLRTWCQGVFWWNWETDPNAGGPGNPYHPMQNKPAEQVLQDYYVPIDWTDPNIEIASARQSGRELIGTGTNAVQGVLEIQVLAEDGNGLAGPPAVTVTANCGSPEAATYLNEGPPGTFNYTWTVNANTCNGAAGVSAQVTDNAGNTANAAPKNLNVNKNQIGGTVGVSTLSGASYGFTREVVFKVTDAGGTVLKAWTEAISFTNDPATRIASGSYTLTDVPDAAVRLSVKTAWSLRERQTVLFDGEMQATINFTLRGGDIDGSNSVNTLDFSVMKANWFSANGVADINGDGSVQLLDYAIMKASFFEQGEAE